MDAPSENLLDQAHQEAGFLSESAPYVINQHAYESNQAFGARALTSRYGGRLLTPSNLAGESISPGPCAPAASLSIPSSQPSREVENILAHGSHRYSSDTPEANLLIPDWSPSLFDHAAAAAGSGFTAGHSFIDRPYYYPNLINPPYDSSLDNEYYEAADPMVTALFIDSLETTTMSEQRNEQERPSTEQVQSLDVSTHDYVPSLDEDEQQR